MSNNFLNKNNNQVNKIETEKLSENFLINNLLINNNNYNNNNKKELLTKLIINNNREVDEEVKEINPQWMINIQPPLIKKKIHNNKNPPINNLLINNNNNNNNNNQLSIKSTNSILKSKEIVLTSGLETGQEISELITTTAGYKNIKNSTEFNDLLLINGGIDFKTVFINNNNNNNNNNLINLINNNNLIIMGSQTKPYRNGEGTFPDYNDFSAHDPYFSLQQNQTTQNLQQQQQQQQHHRTLNNQINFPTIGTFTIDNTTNQITTTSSSSSSTLTNNTSNQVFSSGDPPNILTNLFNNSQNMNMLNGIGNITTSSSSSLSTNYNNNINNNININNNNNNNNNNSNGDPNQGTRETGIIEKLLHSYGFIQCCERQARLFFHFSQFSGITEHLKIGDPVEFEMTYDKRTGKPIASQVTKIAPEVVLSEERVTGTVTTELKSDSNSSSNSSETTGRISYENRGECFFLPYTKDDVEGNVTLRSGDKVSFQIATNQRGNLGACHIRLENPVHPVKYRGVVCSMKESFGFIERADVVKEIFFHFSEAEGSIELRPGDDVEFIIQTRNVCGKEVACNISRLSPGSVIFEDVGCITYKGQVLKPLDRNNPARHNNDPLPGRIRYRATDHSEVEVPFGDKDQKGDFTLRHGDWVQFLLATDRRDQLQRATTISLLDETFDLSGEKREQGVVAALKEGFGFLRCVERSTRLFFHFTEVLDTAREICVGDEVEFTVIQDPGSSYSNTRQSAIRIKHLPNGTVLFETLIESNVEGVVTREAPKSPIKSLERTEGGVISYGPIGNRKTIMYFLKDCDKTPRSGDNVRFNICQVKRNKELIAVNIQEISIHNQQQHHHQQQQQQQNGDLITTSQRNGITIKVDRQQQQQQQGNKNIMNNINNNCNNGNGNSGKSNIIHQGFIAVLKENFGFIETLAHDEEVFFHFSNYGGNSNHLELGQEVEYSLTRGNNSGSGGNCLPAENVKLLSKGTIIQPKVLPQQYDGHVIRPLRCINPDQTHYSGLIEITNDDDVITTHEFGITSLINKRDLLQKNDTVVFKIDEVGRAAEVSAIRQKKKANVDSIKGQFGFLDFEVDEGKKLFFHMTEVQGNSNNLHQGDTVEFSIVTNQRTGKSSACNVVKLNDNVTPARPERLISRLKMNSIDESVPRLIIIRGPKGPDGTKGFSTINRSPRLAGVFVE